jgi:6-phosphogluconolactonase
MPQTKKKKTPSPVPKPQKTKTTDKRKTPSPKTKKNSHASGVAMIQLATFSPEVNVYPTSNLLFEETAPLVMKLAREAADVRGRFVWALPGGSTPKGLFHQLSEDPYLSLMPWEKTYVFWTDERHVPLNHETSNYRLAQEHFLSKVPIPKTNVFPMTDATYPVDRSASLYEFKLKKFFNQPGGFPRFDLILLGMGEDGHTAGLFPGAQQLNEQKRWVVGYFVDDLRKERISLTFPVINLSRTLMVLVEGRKKAEMAKAALEGPSEPLQYPIQYLRPIGGSFLFLMDEAAASLLNRPSTGG